MSRTIIIYIDDQDKA